MEEERESLIKQIDNYKLLVNELKTEVSFCYLLISE